MWQRITQMSAKGHYTHTWLEYSLLVNFSFNLECGDISLWSRQSYQSFLVSLIPHTKELYKKKKKKFFDRKKKTKNKKLQQQKKKQVIFGKAISHNSAWCSETCSSVIDGDINTLEVPFTLNCKKFIWIKSIEGIPSKQMMLVLLA